MDASGALTERGHRRTSSSPKRRQSSADGLRTSSSKADREAAAAAVEQEREQREREKERRRAAAEEKRLAELERLVGGFTEQRMLLESTGGGGSSSSSAPPPRPAPPAKERTQQSGGYPSGGTGGDADLLLATATPTSAGARAASPELADANLAGCAELLEEMERERDMWEAKAAAIESTQRSRPGTAAGPAPNTVAGPPGGQLSEGSLLLVRQRLEAEQVQEQMQEIPEDVAEAQHLPDHKPRRSAVSASAKKWAAGRAKRKRQQCAVRSNGGTPCASRPQSRAGLPLSPGEEDEAAPGGVLIIPEGVAEIGEAGSDAEEEN